MSEASNTKALPPEQGDPSLGTLLETIFRAWKTADVRFLILRNYKNLPHETGNDVDVLVSPSQASKAEATMIQAAESVGYLLHNRVEFATLSCFFFHPATLRQIQIDLFSTLKWHTFELLSADELIEARIPSRSFFIPDPLHEAVSNLITRLVYCGSVRESYRPSILAGFQKDSSRARAILARLFGVTLSQAMVARALSGDWVGIEQLWRRLQRALVVRRISRTPLRTLRFLCSDTLRMLRRWLHPAGMTITVLGADGSGKSTVSAQVLENLRNTFNPAKGLEVHWKPVVFFRKRRKGTGLPNVNPHGKQPRGRLASLGYLFGHWLEYILGSQFLFRPVLFKNGLVFIDRYYYDFLVDPRRYRLNVPQGVIRFLFRGVKEPDLVFLFDAPPEVLQGRKQEVPFEETARQVAAYRKLVESLPKGHVLDASKPIEKVAADMTSQILWWLHRR